MRDSIPLDVRKRKSERICGELVERMVGDYETIGIFASMKSEVDLSPFAKALYKSCHVVCYPVMFRQAEGDLIMEFAAVTEGVTEEFMTNPLKVYEPGGVEIIDPKKLDLLVCPLVAFDKNNNRMGYGGGNYDRYLPRLRDNAEIVGVAFLEQKVDYLPREPHDLPLSKIIYY